MSSAILFHGNDSDIITKTMRKRAMEILDVSSEEALLCHGDYQEVMPTSKSYLYSMETIHLVVEESSLPPFRAKKRIIALLSIDRMLPVHANALLKTLEDAPLNFIMLLTTTAYEDIIKTILSRVQKEFVPGMVEHTDYTEQINNMLHALKVEKYETFFKEVEGIDRLILEDNSVSEGKFRHFLELYMKVCLEKYSGSHLYASHAHILQSAVENAIVAFHGNIRVKHIIENLVLNGKEQLYSM